MKFACGLLLILLVIGPALAQEFLPSPPADRNSVYILDAETRLVSLPIEVGHTPLHPEAIANREKISYIELKSEHAAMVMGDMPRLFLFNRVGLHAPFLVWLEPHRGSRRVVVVTQKGLRGFAVASEQIVKPVIRVLARDGDIVFTELRPRVSLVPGEYAIIGDDLTRIATFRVLASR